MGSLNNGGACKVPNNGICAQALGSLRCHYDNDGDCDRESSQMFDLGCQNYVPEDCTDNVDCNNLHWNTCSDGSTCEDNAGTLSTGCMTEAGTCNYDYQADIAGTCNYLGSGSLTCADYHPTAAAGLGVCGTPNCCLTGTGAPLCGAGNDTADSHGRFPDGCYKVMDGDCPCNQ